MISGAKMVRKLWEQTVAKYECIGQKYKSFLLKSYGISIIKFFWIKNRNKGDKYVIKEIGENI